MRNAECLETEAYPRLEPYRSYDSPVGTEPRTTPTPPEVAGGVSGGAYITVTEGDCIESIAFDRGLCWESVWQHPQNRALRSARKDPNVLLPGDRVFVPARMLRWEDAETNNCHEFVLKGVPSRVQIQMLDDQNKPRAGLTFMVEVEGNCQWGKTDQDGWVRIPIRPNAVRGRLVILNDGREEEYDLNLGRVDPIEDPRGVRQRLRNLGFDISEDVDDTAEQTRAAVMTFQREQDLPVSGDVDETTLAMLRQVYGC